MRRLYLLLNILLISQFVYSNTYLPVERYTANDGLSHSVVTSIYLDCRGFLWIGTTDGLNRYDGYSFRKFYADPRDAFTLPSDNILKVFEDLQGNIWCASSLGVSKYNNSANNFTSITYHNSTDSSAELNSYNDMAYNKVSNRIYLVGDYCIDEVDPDKATLTRIFSGGKRDPYFSTAFTHIIVCPKMNALIVNGSEQVYFFDLNSNKLNPIFENLKKKIINEGGIRGTFASSQSGFYLYTSNTIWHSIKSKNEVLSLELIDLGMDVSDKILSAYSDTNNLLRILTTSSEVIYNARSGEVLFSNKIDLQTELFTNITSFIEDKSGVIWIGSNMGLLKYKKHKNIFNEILISEIPSFIPGGQLVNACFDSYGNIWGGLNTGQLFVIKYQKNREQINLLDKFDLRAKIYDFTCDSSGNIIIGSGNGLNIFWNNPNNFIYQKKVYLSGQSISAVGTDENDTIWISGEKGFYSMALKSQNIRMNEKLSELTKGKNVIRIRSSEKYLWLILSSKIIEYDKNNSDIKIVSFPNAGMSGTPVIISTFIYSDHELLIGTADGGFLYSAPEKKIIAFAPETDLTNNQVHAINRDNNGGFWLSTNRGMIYYNPDNGIFRNIDQYDGLTMTIFSDRITSKTVDGRILFGGKQGITIFSPDSIIINKNIPQIQYTEAILIGKNEHFMRILLEKDTLNVDSKFRYIKISFSSLDFWSPGKNQYQYSLEKSTVNDNWVANGNQNYIIVSGLRAGYYRLKIKGSNNEGIWSENNSDLIIHVIAPFWQTNFALLVYALLVAISFYLSVFLRTKHLRKLNKRYRERELISRKIEQQKEELTVKNKNITDSINYAKRIQMALMPSQKKFTKLFPDSFILHMPKDIVSGDFYWINEVDDRVYFAAVDCTGHGVPGAFMSIIGFELFRRITETEKKKQPAEILNSLNKGLETFFRDVESHSLRDGMDVAFCAIDKERKYMEFAGAFNPLYIVRDNTIIEIKGDRFSVGLNQDKEEETNRFKNHVLQLNDGDIIYVFTDGYADQFGGPEGKKYKYRRFRHLLLALHQLSMDRQVEFLQRSINDWRGESDQVDDILIMGIRISNKSE